MRQQSKENRCETIKWICPCTVYKVDEGLMYYIEYKTEGSLIKFQKVHPQFIKKFIGESSKLKDSKADFNIKNLWKRYFNGNES